MGGGGGLDFTEAAFVIFPIDSGTWCDPQVASCTGALEVNAVSATKAIFTARTCSASHN